MPIALACSCGKKLKVKDEHAGKRVRCPQCGRSLHIPYRLEEAAEGQGISSSHSTTSSPSVDVETQRELKKLVRLHHAVEEASAQPEEVTPALRVGCGSGCGAAILTAMISGAFLGANPARPTERHPMGLALAFLALVMTTGVVGLYTYWRRGREREEKCAEAQDRLDEAIARIEEGFPQVVQAVGGAEALHDVWALEKVVEPHRPARKRQQSRFVADAMEGILGGDLDGANSVAGAIARGGSQGSCPPGYMEVPRPTGDGLCSDDACPCGHPGAHIPRGKGYLYISPEVVELRGSCPSAAEIRARLDAVGSFLGGMVILGGSGAVSPVLMCELGARKRQLDLETAAADARFWWQTGLAPLRPAPTA